VKKTIFALIVLALVVASLAGGAAFLLEQKQLLEKGRIARQAEDKLNDKAYDQAISMLRKVDAEGGTDRSTYLLGRAFTEQGKFEEAGRYYETVLKKYPNSPLVADARLALARYHLDISKDQEEATNQLLDILKYWSKSPAADHALVLLAELSLKKGDEALARKNLELVLRKKNSPAKSEAEFLIGDLNMKRLKSPEAAPGDEVYTIQRGDTLWGLEKKLKIPQDLLIGINDLNPNALSIGRQIRVPRLQISLVIDKAARTLTIRNGNDFLKKYHVGLNQDDSKLPAKDTYNIIKKYDKGMEWVNPETNETVKAGDPRNPYGKRYLELGSITAIHGTNDEEKVGKLVSEGIVLMKNQDLEEVYALVQPKTRVSVKNSVNAEATPVH